ncbi:MAG: enoyl-CoA hydratase-related protein [Gammaproteobacteria bacterium]|nr:enoyl-CoA hydratase-related protein [Gammaproteobacteria bacterium]
MTSTDFQIEDRSECLVFRITRPARLNAITGSVLNGLEQCIDSLEQDTGNRGLIIIGDGEKAFCAGTDLFERNSMSEDDRAKKSDRARDLIVRLHRASFISIAALNGLAYGGGLELAMACTFRIALPQVNCSLPEVKIGLIPAYAGTQLLPAIVGPSRALDMMITGRPIGSEEALQFGLINRITIPEIPLLDQARHYLSSITKHSKVALNAIRACAEVATPQLGEAGLQIEKDYVVAVGKSEDAKEGVAAFREKRAAIFKHR